jgi:DNA repair exonuclease SbcCD nuclease subunit
MVKILVIGDPHYKVDSIPECEIFTKRVTELATSIQPGLIVILGDILHTHERLHTTALNKAYDLVDKMRNITKTYVLVGNHDYCSNNAFLTDNHWMNGMKEWKNIVIVDKTIIDFIEGEKIVFVPYVPPGRFSEALNTRVGEWENASCIFAHQEFSGCKMGAIISIEGDKWPLTNPHVISGHIHSRQIVQKNIYYPGSAMQIAFGESEKNIIPIMNLVDHEYNLEEIDLGLPRKKIVYMDIEDIDSYVPPDTADTVKVTLSGGYEQFKAIKKTKKYKELVDKGVKVVFKTKKLEKKEKADSLNNAQENMVDGVHFGDILRDIIAETADLYLHQSYQSVVNGKEIGINDMLFL